MSNNKKIYKLRFWYGLKEHTVEIGDADYIIQEIFSEWYPTVSLESNIWGTDTNYQININFKKMEIDITMIDKDGESLIPGTKEVLDDRFWTIEWDEEPEGNFNMGINI